MKANVCHIISITITIAAVIAIFLDEWMGGMLFLILAGQWRIEATVLERK